jgi:hypothetical protein
MLSETPWAGHRPPCVLSGPPWASNGPHVCNLNPHGGVPDLYESCRPMQISLGSLRLTFRTLAGGTQVFGEVSALGSPSPLKLVSRTATCMWTRGRSLILETSLPPALNGSGEGMPCHTQGMCRLFSNITCMNDSLHALTMRTNACQRRTHSLYNAPRDTDVSGCVSTAYAWAVSSRAAFGLGGMRHPSH